MTELVSILYRYFSRHRIQMYLLLGLSVLALSLSAVRLRFDENIISFLPVDDSTGTTVDVFGNLKVSDRFILMFSMSDGRQNDGSLQEAADSLVSFIRTGDTYGLVENIVDRVDGETVSSVTGFVFDHLPVFLTDDVYSRLDSLECPDVLEHQLQADRSLLLSPAGGFLKEYILKDPLGLAIPVLSSLSDLEPDSEYIVDGDRIFSPDGSTMLCFLTPRYGTGETGNNDALVTLVEDAIGRISSSYPGVDVEYFAGPAVGVYNARQIKRDTMLTSGVAALLVAAVIFLSFRRRRTIPLVFLPVLYGMLFSLGIIAAFKDSISAIAAGTGAVVLGIALSYSIHVIVHQMHVRSIEQLVRELAFPLTVGSLTTIGAFLGLLFTSSSLLRDFGMFASLSLTGTILFTLIFLPHFLSPMYGVERTPLMKRIDRINGYGYESNIWLTVMIAVLFIISLFTSRRVGLDPDMMKLSYMPERLAAAERRLESFSGGEYENVLFVSAGSSMGEACRAYSSAGRILDSLEKSGLVHSFSTAEKFIIPYEVQKERIERWNRWWTEARKAGMIEAVKEASSVTGYRPGAFDGFGEMLSKEYSIAEYSVLPVMQDWICESDSLIMLVSAAALDPHDKAEVYSSFKDSGTIVFDRSWFAESAVESMSEDLDIILWISSLLVFFGLWVSYRRLEMAVLSFLPMLVTWIIIVGIMGVAGIGFNIVNMVICTFIFGIGDDFSIFITDGLSRRFATGEDALSAHKTAIFFSAFTVVAGMGAMTAARHPALHSVGMISLLGMTAVLLTAYILQPLIFRLFVSGPVSSGKHPYTFKGTLVSLFLWTSFVIACILTAVSILFVLPLHIDKFRKQLFVRKVACYGCRAVLKCAPVVKPVLRNPGSEDFSKPAVIVSNHQSYLDIVWMLALNPKILILAKDWVRKVPVFYPIARFVGFYYTDEGYESIASDFAGRIAQGWSLAVFPEGTRETDGRVHRFHSGAFYIAERLGIDIVPVVMYGNGRVFPKHSPLNMAVGVSVVEIGGRIVPDKTGYRAVAKDVREYVRNRYSEMETEYASLSNPYYEWAVKRSMAYKGTAAESAARGLFRRREYLEALDNDIPRKGRILFLGCGTGQAVLLLKLLSPEREIVAVDSDHDNIMIAVHNYLNPPGLTYVCADPDSYPVSGYDKVVYLENMHN